MSVRAITLAVLSLVAAGPALAQGGDAALEDGAAGPGSIGSETVLVEADRASGPHLSDAGTADYAIQAADIDRLPAGTRTPITEVLAQFPGVAIDQNQQIHIRSTEGPQFQYQINGFLVPLDINTNPPFVSMLNPLFIQRLDLLVGTVPARYGFATGGVVDLQTKDGCLAPGGEVSVQGGQRSTLSPSIAYAACNGAFSSYFSARETWSNTAFSSATPGPTPIHDQGRQQQALGFWSYALATQTRLALLIAATHSDNQLPNASGLAPAFTVAGFTQIPPSADIDSRLNFRDYLAMASLKSSPAPGLDVQLAYTAHFISQVFNPDQAGELVYQGVASQASHEDRDNTLEGDLRRVSGAHTLEAGLYVGAYGVRNSVDSLVFLADANGQQTSSVPLRVLTGSSTTNVVSALYVSDLWRLTPRLSAGLGLRAEELTGYTHARQLSPRLNLTFRPDAAVDLHAGFARLLQVPSLLGIAPGTPAAFAGTTAAGPPGATLPLAEDDYEYDAGLVARPTQHLTLSVDSYYQRAIRYLDTGQFGVVPIFAPFNYGHGHLWGAELAAQYRVRDFLAYATYTVGKNWQQGVVTGQFNFPPDELAYIDAHPILLDHQPIHGATAGVSYEFGRYALSGDALYSSGLATGFADTRTLPQVIQINASAERTLQLPGRLPVSIRLSVLNLLDRVNQIRSAQGIGIFQAAYGPRRTVYATLSVRF